LEEPWKRLPQYFPSERRRRVSGRDHQSRTKRPSAVDLSSERTEIVTNCQSAMRTAKGKNKQVAYHGGRQAAVRFEATMKKILSVPKEKILELEKQSKEKRRASRNGLSG